MNVARWHRTALPGGRGENLRRARTLRSFFRALDLLGGFGIAAALWTLGFATFLVPALLALASAATLLTARRCARLAKETLAEDLSGARPLAQAFGRKVALMVHQGATPTGFDEGTLWIEEERLYFAGERTSFGLTAEQTTDFCRHVSAIDGLRHELWLPLAASTELGPLAISIGLPAHSHENRTRIFDVREEINRWSARSGAVDGQLPPLDLAPEAPSRARLLLGAVFSGGYWTLTVLVVASLLVLGSLFTAPIAIAAGVVGTRWRPVTSPVARFRAWRDRARAGGER